MKSKTCISFSELLLGKLTLIIFFAFFLIPALVSAQNAEYWIALAEKYCIYENQYTVNVTTEVFLIPEDTTTNHAMNKVLANGKSIEKSSALLKYTKEDGLRNTLHQENTEDMSTSSKRSSFILDVGYMLKKMKGKARWVLEDDHKFLGKQDCVVISSSGENWLVRLWINRKDGKVLCYDQYLNNKYIGRSMIKYGQPLDGKYFPTEATTHFHLTGHIIKLTYNEYSF
ncbi:MAG: hypothetical protein ACFFCW_20370 [Candidatus Hodarchaeota archaeon]